MYPLTIEPHTPFDAAIMRGEMDEPDEDVEAAAMEDARLILEDAGFHRYEVASYARPGFESRHNTAYWTGKPLSLIHIWCSMRKSTRSPMPVKGLPWAGSTRSTS